MEEICDSALDILPDEVISMVLRFNDIHDIIQFGTTCRRFNDLVKNNQVLWRKKFKALIPNIMFQIIESHTDGDWLYEVVDYFKHKTKIFAELSSTSKQMHSNDETKEHGNHGERYSLKSVRILILMSLTSNYSFYYTVHILQTAIKHQGKENVRALLDYEITCAKYCLQYLLHLYLAVKWVAGEEHLRNDLTPIAVVNYFQQWVDTENIYPEEIVEHEMQELIRKVNLIIQARHPTKYTGDIKESLEKGRITQKHILDAISTLIYQEMQIRVTGNATLENLNIRNVINNKFGNTVVVAAIYQALARRCGVKCELIAFPNHLFLEWKDDRPRPDYYTVDLTSGKLQIKRRCPFSQYSENNPSYGYCPDSLLLYIYSSYHMSTLSNNGNTQSAAHLLDFLGTGSHEHDYYRNFLPFLLESQHMVFLLNELSMYHLSDQQLHLMTAMAMLRSEDR